MEETLRSALWLPFDDGSDTPTTESGEKWLRDTYTASQENQEGLVVYTVVCWKISSKPRIWRSIGRVG
jgi:hypothetical protein